MGFGVMSSLFAGRPLRRVSHGDDEWLVAKDVLALVDVAASQEM